MNGDEAMDDWVKTLSPGHRVALASAVLFSWTLLSGLATSGGDAVVNEVLQAVLVALLSVSSWWKNKLDIDGGA